MAANLWLDEEDANLVLVIIEEAVELLELAAVEGGVALAFARRAWALGQVEVRQGVSMAVHGRPWHPRDGRGPR